MKLVAAKCPSCGANIDVNPERKTTKCEYCNSKIVIEDAIAKFKIEISGEVEIKNMPKLINYIKLGNRSYNDLEYKEALNYYTKALELDPDNYIAILRIGICKTLLTDYAKFEIKHAFNAIRHVNDLLRNNDQTEVIDSCIIEVNNTFNWLVNLVTSFYNNSYRTDLNKINGINDKLMSCITAFEYLYNICEKEATKKIVLKSLVSTIDFLLQKKRYSKIDKNGNTSYAYEILKPYERFNLYSEKREKYLCKLDPDYAKKKEEERKHQEEIKQNHLKWKKEKEEEAKRNLKIPFRPIDILSYIGVFVCLLLFLICINSNYDISGIVWLAGVIIYIPYVKNFIVSKNGDYYEIILMARVGIFIAGIIALGL